ncbi:MarR family winged helix-turn-helix transcriptional regulator [Nocardia sp. NPDC057668]|uniref:MarR family winged helix-turn-helix transcriptional regulator n=1 Tax=Nocardia sp. NPDC057668 TaxID=3346202 RepID=UPI00366BF34A
MTAQRPDLAAMIVPLGRALLAAERPILDDHDLSMWAYIVLQALHDRPARGQGALAQEIGADKTRIIAVLDDLQSRSLIDRYPDPADRRARLLSLTASGEALRKKVRSAIRAHEDRLLNTLSPTDRRGFLNALTALSSRAQSD